MPATSLARAAGPKGCVPAFVEFLKTRGTVEWAVEWLKETNAQVAEGESIADIF